MEKMIGVINNSLRNVITGIKTHRADAEKNLAVIKADMDDKVLIAAQYKVNVEDARTIIAGLENEISDLENDLKHLNETFGSKNFTEILSAGNKEINTKIIEKRAAISQQNQRILDLTEKAHVLKEDLIKLKQRKASLEESLNKSVSLERYYDLRITDIITYSEEHSNELDKFELAPKEEKQVNVNELVYKDFGVEATPVDGSVFEEIDELSTLELDEETLNQVIEDLQENRVSDDEDLDILEDTPGYVDLTMTQQLDDIILAANKIISSERASIVPEKAVEETTQLVEEVKVTKVEVEEAPVVEEVIEEVTEEIVEEVKEEEAPVVEEVKEVEETAEESVGDAISKVLEDIKVVDDDLEDEDDEDEVQLIPFEELEATVNKNKIPVPEVVEDTEKVEKPTVINNEIKEMEVNIPEENDQPLNVMSNVFNKSIFDKESTNFYDLLNECNLDHDRFSADDLIKLENKFNKDMIVDFVNVLKKHNVAISRIYDNVDVMLNVTPQNMDYIISLLYRTGASNEAVGYVFDKLDKVSINSLELAVNNNPTRELTEILFDAIPYEGDSDILNRIGLNPKEEADLKRYATLEEFKMINLFPEVVLTNYNTLKGLRINNLNECFTKHPHRFIFNPDRFNAILDKYDTDDLIRCINKNCAVIDKL